MYDLAHSLRAERPEASLFLRAQREPDGRRTYKLLEGEPLPTSYGEDSYRRIFGDAGAPHAAVESRRAAVSSGPVRVRSEASDEARSQCGGPADGL